MNGDKDELLASIKKISDPFMAGSCSALVKVIANNSDMVINTNILVMYVIPGTFGTI